MSAETQTTETTKSQQERFGRVVSISGEQTISVQVDNLIRHALYGKYIRSRSKLAVHDEKNEARVGDTVVITKCRPISKRKAHRLVRIAVRPTLAQD